MNVCMLSTERTTSVLRRAIRAESRRAAGAWAWAANSGVRRMKAADTRRFMVAPGLALYGRGHANGRQPRENQHQDRIRGERTVVWFLRCRLENLHHRECEQQ